MKITKSNIESYKIRFENSSIWADINIDYAKESGRLQIASDFGNWQYHWGACGDSFKKFLSQLDKGYLANKFGENRHFNIEKTITNIRETVVSEFYPEIKKENYDLVEGYDDYEIAVQERSEIMSHIELELKLLSGAFSSSDFVHCWWNCNKLTNLFNTPDLEHGISPMFERFWSEIWKGFINEIVNEKEITTDTTVIEK
jgi:hypothetical protein